MKTPRPGTGPDVGEGSGLSSASLVPPASPRNGHSRGGAGFSHGLACCQVWGDNHQERDARGGEGEWRLGDAQVTLPGDFPVAVSGGRRTGVRLGGGLNGEGSVASRCLAGTRSPEDVSPAGDRTSEMRAAVRPVPRGEEQRPGRTEARALGVGIPLRGPRELPAAFPPRFLPAQENPPPPVSLPAKHDASCL